MPGSARLVLSRFVLFILSALPGLLVSLGALGETIGRRPYFADAPAPLPMVPLTELLRAVPGPVWAALAAGG